MSKSLNLAARSHFGREGPHVRVTEDRGSHILSLSNIVCIGLNEFAGARSYGKPKIHAIRYPRRSRARLGILGLVHRAGLHRWISRAAFTIND